MSTRTLTGLLSLVDGAAFLLSRRGRVVSCNSEAASITHKDSYCVLRRDKHLVFRDARDDEAYLKALSLAFASARPRMSSFPVTGACSPDSVAFLLPLAQAGTQIEQPIQDTHAVFILRACALAAAPSATLRGLYGLTTAEIDIVNALMLGRNVETAAQSLGISRATARNQISAAMAKMGVNRQAQLVAQVGALVPRLRLC
jgi:DNA-binding CsgD family transcriptional regulator